MCVGHREEGRQGRVSVDHSASVGPVLSEAALSHLRYLNYAGKEP